MIVCRNLTRQFGSFTAVDRLSLEVLPGTMCVFLGPNGAGKSTTLKMLTGILPPTSGDALVCNRNVVTHALEVKQRIGVLPEDLGLFDDLTIEEHLSLTGQIYGLTKGETRTRTRQLMDMLGLASAHDRLASQSSHGMRKKTSFAMALLPNPEVVFLDEPFEAIDPVTSRVMQEMLLSAAKRGTTVFFTSHILPIAERIATQVIILQGGKLAWNSSMSALDRPLQDLYFELVNPPKTEEIPWLGSSQS
jgi:ABC-2 type transport system ATP-binding protein